MSDDGDTWEDFFGPTDGAPAGVSVASDLRTRQHHVKAATAFLLEYFAMLPGNSRRVEQLAHQIAYTLSERRFPFAGKNAGGDLDMHPYGKDIRPNNPLILERGKQIERWRRHLRRKNATDEAAPLFKNYRASPPFNTSDRHMALAWWYEELVRNGY